MIPDIGSPGMTVYVELIAPFSTKDNFSMDGPYSNTSSDMVQVVTANPADASKIVIGPLLVSWDGRAISTQIFVSHQLNPNSVDALNASPEFQIPIKVIVSGKESNRVTFYIVKSRPYLDARLFPNDSIIGEGNLGKRSPRGAMIFDSLKLDEKKYRVSVKDCDPNTDGNQAYLPFILLVKGNIYGGGSTMGSFSTVSVNGGENGDGFVQNAGPGGGGGGGSFYDSPSEIGFPGGDGFTGGGPGGRNDWLLGDNTYLRTPSKGSGPYKGKDDKDGGYSLNGLPGSRFQSYEAAGGGSGNPFGESGFGCGDGNNCEPIGGYGGGSGYKQDSPGGAGGNATYGQGSKENGGKVHGNKMVVPIAGGSGGAGGNPKCESFSDKSGAGGSGGGAIRIFAENISNFKVTANGAGGATNGCKNSWGGSGSGGHVGLQAKIGIFNSSIQVEGGRNSKSEGGAGRARYDSPLSNNLNITTAQATTYIGATTDTTLWIKKNHIIKGSQDNSGLTSNLYLRGQNSNWTIIGQVTSQNWSFDLTNFLYTNENIYYFTVMTDVKNPSDQDYIEEPLRVMSQAAANIFFLDVRPFIGGDSVIKASRLYCTGDTIFLSAHITNLQKADKNLNINISDNNWLNGAYGFKIIGPLGDYTIKPGDTMQIIVQFVLPDGADPDLTFTKYLILPSDDPDRPAGNDWKIKFEVPPAKKAVLSYFPPITVPVILSDTKIGQPRYYSYTVKNTGETKLYIESIDPLALPYELISTVPALPAILEIGQTLTVSLKFTPMAVEQFSTKVNINAVKSDTTCALIASTEIISKGVQSDININKIIMDFGLVPWCKTVTDTIRISNSPSASASFQINEMPQIIGNYPQFFKIIKYPGSFPVVITQGDGVEFVIEFNLNSGSTGPKDAIFRFTTDSPESPEIQIGLKGEFVSFNTMPTPPSIELGNIAVGFDVISSFILSNFAKIDETIGSIKSTGNLINFQTPSNQIINPNGGISKVDFILNSKKSGNIFDTILVAFEEPCIDTLKIPVYANGILTNPLILIENDTVVSNFDTVITRELDFGDFPVCSDLGMLKVVEFKNNFEAPYIVLNEELISNPSGRFSIDRTGLTYPDTVKGLSNRYGAQIYFNTANGITGLYTAVIRFQLYINGIFYEYKINLKAKIFDGNYTFSLNPVKLEAIVFTTNSQNILIENIGPGDLYFEPIDGPTLKPIFDIFPDPAGNTVSIGNSITFKISFTPTDVLLYKDSIVFHLINSLCVETYTLYLEGNGRPSKELSVWIPDLITTPDQINYKIPIFGKFSKPLDSLNNFGMTFKLKFNRSIYFPTDILDGNLIENYLQGNERIIKVFLNNVSISNTDTIVSYLNGSTLLGDSIITPIEFDSLNVSQPELISTLKSSNGSLSIEICNQGGDRLLINGFSPASIIAIPNPVNDVFIVKVKALEKGSHILSIIDLQGNKSLIHNWYNNNPGDEISVSVDAHKFSSGLYYLELKAPTQVKVINLNIIK
jgi:hypothetical protein